MKRMIDFPNYEKKKFYFEKYFLYKPVEICIGIYIL